MNLEFNKNPPDYVLGEPVTMTVFVTDENGIPVRAGLESVVVVPGGDIYSDVLWVEISPGLYTASYVPHQEGEYSITVTVKEGYTCYGEDASATFSVECDTALVYWTTSTVIIGEPARFLLMITDTEGDFLPGAFIETDIYYQDEYIATLTWTYDDENSIYTAQYTFSELGVYDVTGTVTVFKENTCFTASVTEHFTVIKKNLPDLVIHNEDIIIEPDPHLNTTVTISVTVWNFGKGDAECFWVILLINDYIVHREPIALLTAGEKYTFMYEWTILYSGSYIIQAIADPPEGLI
jgi:hypothetical protein